MKALALTVLFACLAPGQTTDAAGIEGKVIGPSGESIARVTLRLMKGNDTAFAALSDDDGAFRFAGLPPGRYGLVATKTGFVDRRYVRLADPAADPSMAFLDVDVGVILRDVVIRLTPQGVIAGRVTDLVGGAVPGIQVLAMRQGFANGRRQWVTVESARTDDRGEYRLANLPYGSYSVQASDPSLLSATVNPGPREGQRRTAVAPTYYPNADHPDRAAILEVSPQSEWLDTNIRLLQSPVYSVRGRAVTDDGTSLAGRRLVLAPVGSGQVAMTIVRNYGVALIEADGSFEVQNLRPGTFEIAFAGYSAQGYDYTSRMRIPITSKDIEGLEVPFVRSGRIVGVVSVEGDANPAIPSNLIVRLVQMEGTPSSIGDGRVQGDGAFHIPGTGALRYLWSVSGLPPHFYVRSVSFGDEDVSLTPIDNTSALGGQLRIVLAADAATIAGVAAPGLTVCLWPKTANLGSAGGGVRNTIASQDGAFELTGIAPGEYYVGAWEGLDRGLIAHAFLSRFQSDVALVSLQAKDRRTIPVNVVSAERLAQEIADVSR